MNERSRWTLTDSVAIGLTTAAAAWLRADHLARPPVIVFDEFFYAREACFLVHRSEQLCGVGKLAVSPHPPLGKWLIAIGIDAFGYRPIGWRIPALVAGVVTVALVYVFARRALGTTPGAVITAVLLAIDPLHLVQSRIAMLDVFVTAFVVAAFTCLAFDGGPRSGDAPASDRSMIRGRPWLLAAGAIAGAAAATKWVGFLALGGVAALAFASAWTRANGTAVARLRRSMRAEGPPLLIALVVLPAAVYVASFVGSVKGAVLAPPWEAGSWTRNFLAEQEEMLRFHLRIEDVSPYTSPAWSWPLIRRPVVYFADRSADEYREILAMGNPLVWWASIPALLALAGSAVSRRARDDPAVPIVVGFSVLYLPWLLIATGRSFTFLFYLLPAVPFMCLAIAAVAARSWGSSGGKAASAVFCGAAVASFAFFHPVLTAAPISASAAEARQWFDDCDVSPGALAPEGWCWSGSGDAAAGDT